MQHRSAFVIVAPVCTVLSLMTLAVLADDPRLTTREVEGASPQPVILDSHLRFPLDARLMDHPKKPWIMTAPLRDDSKLKKFKAVGMEVRSVDLDAGDYLDLNEVLSCLNKLGVKSVMVEGGAKVITSFLKQRLADLVIITVAPVFLGGMPPISERMDLEGLPRIWQMKHKQFGEDVVVWGKLAPEEQ